MSSIWYVSRLSNGMVRVRLFGSDGNLAIDEWDNDITLHPEALIEHMHYLDIKYPVPRFEMD